MHPFSPPILQFQNHPLFGAYQQLLNLNITWRQCKMLFLAWKNFHICASFANPGNLVPGLRSSRITVTQHNLMSQQLTLQCSVPSSNPQNHIIFPMSSAVYWRKSVITYGLLCQKLMVKAWKISQQWKQKHFPYNTVERLSPRLLISSNQLSS